MTLSEEQRGELSKRLRSDLPLADTGRDEQSILKRPKAILSEKELAAVLGLSPWTVRLLRLQEGLPHVRTSERIFYRLETALRWFDEREQACRKAHVEADGEYGTIRPIR